MMPTRVYCITNSCNGKMYVGVTCGTLAKRWWTHQRDSAKGSSVPLHRAIRKYGPSVFSLEELFEYPSRDEALEAEKYLIAILGLRSSGGYNASDGGEGGSAMRGRTHSPETRARMSAAQRVRVLSDAAKARMSAAPRGRPRSDATKAKISAALSGRVLSDSHRARIAASRKVAPAAREMAAMIASLPIWAATTTGVISLA